MQHQRDSGFYVAMIGESSLAHVLRNGKENGKALCGARPATGHWSHVRKWTPPREKPVGICPACWSSVS